MCLTAELLPLCLEGGHDPAGTTTPAGQASTCLAHPVTAGTAAAAPGPAEIIRQLDPCVHPSSSAEGLSQAQHHAGHQGIPDNCLIKVIC